MDFTKINQLSTTYLLLPVDTWIGIVGLLLGGVFYVLSRKRPLPTAIITWSWWLSEKRSPPHEELKVTFRGVPVTNVSMSTITFWNAGNAVLKFEDYSDSSPLRIEIPSDIEVFSVSKAKTSPTDLKFEIDRSQVEKNDPNRSIRLMFDFLQPGHGLKLVLVHDGTIENSHRILLTGRYSGEGKLLVTDQRNSFSISKSWRERIFVSLAMFAFGSLGIFSVYQTINDGFRWYFGFGYLFLVYFAVVPTVIFSRNGPNNL